MKTKTFGTARPSPAPRPPCWIAAETSSLRPASHLTSCCCRAGSITRIEASNDQHDKYMQLDVATDVYPMKMGDRFTMILAPTLNLDGTPHTGYYIQEGVTRWLRSAAAALAIAAQISVALPAAAVLYSPDTSLPRTGELALRRAIPGNPNMKAIQESLEDISYLPRIPQRKPYGTMEADVKKAMKIATDNKEAILGSIPAEHKEEGAKLYTALLKQKPRRSEQPWS